MNSMSLDLPVIPIEETRCFHCKYYDEAFLGHEPDSKWATAPCIKWNCSGVLWNEHCSRFEVANKEAVK